MLRGYADVGERAAFDRAFRELKTDEREHLYKARRRHKTVAVFLHELAHNLGCPHRSEPDTLMSPMYSYQSTSFDPVSRATMQATIDQRLGRTPTAPTPQPDAHPTLVIEIDAAGNSSVGGNVVDDATLDGLFRLSFNDDRETAIVIKAKAKAPQSAVIKVVDRAKAAGLKRISIGRE
jgi:biopolymer transport protein ExbD